MVGRIRPPGLKFKTCDVRGRSLKTVRKKTTVLCVFLFVVCKYLVSTVVSQCDGMMPSVSNAVTWWICLESFLLRVTADKDEPTRAKSAVCT